MITKRIKPGQLFTVNGKVFRVRTTHFRSISDCDECRKVNGNPHTLDDCPARECNFYCSFVCGYGHHPQFIRNAK